jgi:hypothetical protein
MGLPSKPLKAVFPIVLKRKSPETYYFLGTGFFVRSDGLFLTAKHVFKNWVLSEGDEFQAVMIDLSINEFIPFPICNLNFSERFDIALGQMEGVKDIQPLILADKHAPMNRDVLAVEFSGTHSQLTESGQKALIFNPYFRKGHVICHYESVFPTSIPTFYMDLSFPALKGASGAPVIVEIGGSVIGMVLGNIERELLPAQIERVTQDGSHIEEIKYFLPAGQAISWVHLVHFVKSISQGD